MTDEQFFNLLLRGLPVLAVVVVVVLRSLGVDVDKGEREKAEAVGETFLHAPRATPDEVTGGRPSKTFGTSLTVHVILLAVFVSLWIAVAVFGRLDALGHFFLVVFLLGPAAFTAYSLLAIERVTIARDRVSLGNLLRGSSREVLYADVADATLMITSSEAYGTAVAHFHLVLETPEGPFALELGKESMRVGTLFPPELRRVDDRFPRPSRPDRPRK